MTADVHVIDLVEEVLGPGLEQFGVPQLWRHATSKGVKVVFTPEYDFSFNCCIQGESPHVTPLPCDPVR